ncbi:sulfatase [Micromonospora sp. SH-82]|uniref:sulfatase n=1 Tax=Micromonospora sp. SH-82 TaxID=3132938 RepID=UPI003EBD899E
MSFLTRPNRDPAPESRPHPAAPGERRRRHAVWPAPRSDGPPETDAPRPDGSGPDVLGPDAPESDAQGPDGSADHDAVEPETGARRGRWRTVGARVTTGLAVLLVLVLLLAPNHLAGYSPWVFTRLPLEPIVVAAALLALRSRSRARRLLAGLVGVLLGTIGILKALDTGFFATLARPFDPALDWSLLGPTYSYLVEANGRPVAVAAAVGAVLLAVALLSLTTLASLRLSRLVVRHDRVAVRAVAVLAVLWVAGAAFGIRVGPGVSVADRSTSRLVTSHVSQVQAAVKDRETFGSEVDADPFEAVPAERLLTGLRGKDVIVAFVESYGRDAVQDPEFSPRVGAVLADGDRRLGEAGYATRSGFLTSSTTGGGSWLAHATLLSGLWIDNDQRHRSLLASDRMTLNRYFQRAGWDTVGVMPAVTRAWPEGQFYGYERFHDSRTLGYQGPKFGFAPIPDQFTLGAFERLERSRPDRAPLFAEIALVTSHSPWTPRPRIVDWSQMGDGTIFNEAREGDGEDVGRSTAQIRADYRRSIEYSLKSLVSYVERYGNDDLVLVVVGDHQPAPVVTGPGASRDVPISIITRDRGVLAQMSDWEWEEGLQPGPQAPVWPMSSFRDRFLTTFGQ